MPPDYPFDPGEDFATVVDGIETVQYQPRTSARGGFGPTSYQVTAHKSQLSKMPLALPNGGETSDTSSVWNLQASDLNGYEARKHDRIIQTLASGTLVYWVVDTVEVQSWVGRFRCTCYREVPGVGQPVT